MENKNVTGTRIIMNWKDHDIRSLKDMRENFEPEELLKAHLNNDLYTWLNQHYYESEAQKVKKIKLEDRKCLTRLCDILGIEYSDPTDPDAAKALEAKREKIKVVTVDKEILDNAAIVALDQEELSELIDAGEKRIYLFDNSFSIPLSKRGISYIGVGDVTIENACTQTQYANAGISIEKIALPANISGISGENKQSPLAREVNEALKPRKLNSFYRLDFNASASSKFYNNRYECESARDKIIEKAYHRAESHFDTSSSKCVAKEAAEYYDSRIRSVLSPILDNIGTLGRLCGKNESFDQLSELVNHAMRHLREKFEEELNGSYDFYSMYNIEYFRDRVDVEEHDYRVSEDGFFKLLERIATDHIQYTLSGVFDSVQEMEKDLNDHASTFFNTAYDEYQDYAAKIVKLIDSISSELPEFSEGESIADYVSRMCVKKAM